MKFRGLPSMANYLKSNPLFRMPALLIFFGRTEIGLRGLPAMRPGHRREDWSRRLEAEAVQAGNVAAGTESAFIVFSVGSPEEGDTLRVPAVDPGTDSCRRAAEHGVPRCPRFRRRLRQFAFLESSSCGIVERKGWGCP